MQIKLSSGRVVTWKTLDSPFKMKCILKALNVPVKCCPREVGERPEDQGRDDGGKIHGGKPINGFSNVQYPAVCPLFSAG